METRPSKLWDAATVRADLARVQRVIDRYASLDPARRTGSTAQAILEKTIREFLVAAALDVPGVTSGVGFWKSADRDVVFDWSSSSDWLAEVRLNMDGAPVLGHLEIHFRAAWDKVKLTTDVARLEEVAGRARAKGLKTWTGLVAVGPGLSGRASDVASAIHGYYTTRPEPVRLVPAEGFPQGSWTFLDVVVLPNVCYKKFDFHEAKARDSARWPVLVPVETEDTDGRAEIRPLAIARAFIAGYLRKAAGEHQDEPAWHKCDDDAVLGCPSSPRPMRHPTVSMRLDAPRTLYYDMHGTRGEPWQTWAAVEGTPWQVRPIDEPPMLPSF